MFILINNTTKEPIGIWTTYAQAANHWNTLVRPLDLTAKAITDIYAKEKTSFTHTIESKDFRLTSAPLWG